MARLIVKAIAEDVLAAPSNAKETVIVVSVTDVNGIPVKGLSRANFVLGSHIVAPGGALSQIQSVVAPMAGIYLLGIIPMAAHPWKPGFYIWSVAVKREQDQGQTLCNCFLN